MKVDPPLSLCIKLNPKWIKNLNLRPETLSLLEGKGANKLDLTGIGKDFLNRTQ